MADDLFRTDRSYHPTKKGNVFSLTMSYVLPCFANLCTLLHFYNIVASANHSSDLSIEARGDMFFCNKLLRSIVVVMEIEIR